MVGGRTSVPWLVLDSVLERRREKAREEEWVGRGDAKEGEGAKGGQRELGGGLLWRGEGAPWVRARDWCWSSKSSKVRR